MPTRALRTETIANIADFGATPGGIGFAAANAIAFRAALASGARKICIPAGAWWFTEIADSLNRFLPPQVEVFGEGVNHTVITYVPTDPGVPLFKAYPNAAGSPPFARTTFRDFTLYGPIAPAVNTPPVSVAIDLDDALFCRIRDVQIWQFGVGISLNQGSMDTYSGYHVIERFEINTCTIGIRGNQSSNAIVIQDGRIWSSLVQYDGSVSGVAREEGTSISLTGVVDTTGPAGGTGVMISGVALETAAVLVEMVACRNVTVIGCYFELGEQPPGFGTTRRRMLSIDAVSDRVHIVGCETSEGNNLGGEESWTPPYVASVPESRNSLEQDSFPASGSGPTYTTNAYGAGLHGATAAYSNRIKNADMSRGTWAWPTANPGVGSSQVSVPTDFVIGGRSTRLAVGNNPLFHMYQDFVLNSGLRSVTVGVRYRLLSATANAFRFDLWDVASSTRLGFFSDTDLGHPTSSAWKIRSLTGRFDGLTGGVQGPRTLRVRIYPYNAAAPGPTGQQVLIDSVWLVDGEYAAPYRPYSEGIEILRGNDRQLLVNQSFAMAVAATPLPFANMPANAVGAILEVRVNAPQGSTVSTYVRLDDNEGDAVTQQTRDIHAPANNRWAMTDFMLPLTPGGASPPTWQLVGASDPNNITFVGIRLKAWVLRM